MQLNKDFEDLLHHLNAANVKFLIVGAYAVINYTTPRYTKDIDIWIKTDSVNAKKTYAALQKFGAPLHNMTPADLENPKMVFQIGVEPNRIDILMDVDGVTFDTAWKNRKRGHYGNEKIHIIGLKELIRAKKKAGRPQDKIDADNLEKISKKKKRKKARHPAT